MQSTQTQAAVDKALASRQLRRQIQARAAISFRKCLIRAGIDARIRNKFVRENIVRDCRYLVFGN